MDAVFHIGLTLFALLGSALPAGAQAKRCVRCKSVGMLPCKEHGGEDLSGEHDVLYCSVVAGCGVCAGTGWLACKACDDGHVAAELASRAALGARSRDALVALDTTMGRALRKGESAHFVLVWEMTGMRVDKQRLDEHQMLHLTLQRLERLYGDYTQLLGIDDKAFEKKSRVFVWYLADDHQRGSTAFCDLYAPRGAKLMGSTPNYSVCGDSSLFRNDEALHRNLVHCCTHLLFSHQQPSAWVGNLGAGWADEGLAHYFEQRYFGLCDNYCYEEQNTQYGFKGGKFRSALRKLVDEDQAPALSGLLHKNSDQLLPAEHALSLALVEYLLELDARKFDQVGRALRAHGESREVLAKVYGLPILTLEERLKAWIQETYPVKD